MPIIYSVRLNCKAGTDPERIRAVMQEWINKNAPETVNILDIGAQSIHDETSKNGDVFTSATALHPSTGVRCTAIRSLTNLQLSKTSPPQQTNLLWQAECISEETADGTRFYINLSRGALSSADPANLETMPVPPRIIFLLINRGLLEPDCGIPFTTLFHREQDVDEAALADAAAGRTLTAMPLVLVSESCHLFAHALSGTLRGTGHIFLLPDSHPLRADLKPDQVLLLYPRACAQKCYTIRRGEAQRILSDVLRLSYFASPNKALTFDMVDYWCVLQGGKQVDHTPKAGYICVSPAMAEALRLYRKKSGLTQAELGEQIGSTGLIISRVENGKTTRVTEQLIRDAEQSLGLLPGTISSLERSNTDTAEGPPVSDTPVKHVFCHKCGAKLLEDSLFCHVCGTKLPL